MCSQKRIMYRVMATALQYTHATVTPAHLHKLDAAQVTTYMTT